MCLSRTTGAILDGRFGQACRSCRTAAGRGAGGQSAQWHRDRDREDNQRDLIQPWVNGKPNTEFIREYPEYAAENFTEDELKEFG